MSGTKGYHKLVRDRIPEIIKAEGDSCRTRVLSEEEYLRELDMKLNEETEEYQADKSIEELADILEVVYAIAAARGCSIAELENLRREKAQERGAFEDKIYLEEVYVNEENL